MRYYKDLQDGYIVAIGTGGGGVEITETEYETILEAIRNKPSRTDTTDYHLREDLTWEEYERIEPPDDTEPSAEEVVDILLGGSDD
ncbi:MAG: hypothetical protein IKB96_00260 [Prevotella sp.]|nr:hypothetical protein [Prevotella sp.]